MYIILDNLRAWITHVELHVRRIEWVDIRSAKVEIRLANRFQCHNYGKRNKLKGLIWEAELQEAVLKRVSNIRAWRREGFRANNVIYGPLP